jgi:hypothetical protein
MRAVAELIAKDQSYFEVLDHRVTLDLEAVL